MQRQEKAIERDLSPTEIDRRFRAERARLAWERLHAPEAYRARIGEPDVGTRPNPNWLKVMW